MRRNMERINVQLYREKDGSYSCYTENSDKLPYGLIGEGETANEAKEDWMRCYEAMKAEWDSETRGDFVEAEFTFSYDMPSMLNYYAGRFTFAGLARITGVSAAQLSQYASGYRHASPRTTEKIQESLRGFGKELCQVTLV